jgi:hypothetical protein
MVQTKKIDLNFNILCTVHIQTYLLEIVFLKALSVKGKQLLFKFCEAWE